jgi:hypothetical protein
MTVEIAMKHVWSSLKTGTIGLFGLIVLVFVLNSGCKQEDELAETGSEGSEAGVAEVLKEEVYQAESKIDLKILYAGHPGSGREQDFSRFLRAHFAEVAVTDLARFKEEEADGFDVVILTYDGDGFNAPRPNISRGFSRPMMTVGVPGAHICGNLSLKMSYL